MAEEKELDIVQLIGKLCSAIKKILVTILVWVGNIIKFIYRNIKTLCVFLVIGVGCAFVLSSSYFREYKGDTILKINVGDSYLFSDLTRTLIPGVQNTKSLAERLNISQEQADAIQSIDPYFVIDNHNNGTPDYIDFNYKYSESDTSNVRMTDRICIRIKTKDIESYPAIQNGLQYFFANNELLKKQNTLKVKHKQEVLKFFENEIVVLDSLRSVDYFKEHPKNITLNLEKQQLLFGQGHKQLYDAELGKLVETRNNAEWTLLLNSDVTTVIAPFVASRLPLNHFSKMLGYSFPFSLLLGLICCLYWENRKKIKRFLNEK
jgi:hypothetical protein